MADYQAVGQAVGDVPQAPAAPPPVAVQNGQVPIVDADGTVSTVAAADFAQAQAEGARLASPGELQAAETQARYGGLGGSLAAAGLGAARGLTLGLSDPAALAAAEAFGGTGARQSLRETLGGYKEANPFASLTGEVAGAALPLLLSGGAGSAAEAGALSRGIRMAGALPRGVAEVGNLAERGAAALVGKGATGLLGRVAQKAVPLAAQGAAEGALYNLGHEISEASLGDQDLTAEKMIAALGHGALLGGGGGALLGAAGSLVEQGSSALARKLFAGETLGGKLDELANKATVSALRPTLRDVKTIERYHGSLEEFGSTVKKALKEELGKPLERASLEEMNQALVRKVDDYGNDLAQMNRKLDAAEKSIATPVARETRDGIAERITRDVIEPLSATPGREAEVARVQNYLDSFVQKTGENPSFEQLHRFRKDLGDQVFSESKKLVQNPGLDNMRDVVRIIEDGYTQGGERVAQELGGAFAADYKAAKKAYSTLETARSISAGRLERDAANQAIGLGDRLFGTIGAAAAGSHGVLAGGLTGIVGAATGKLLRERGNQLAAGLLDRAAQIAKIRSAAARVDQQIESGVRGFLTERTLAPTAPAEWRTMKGKSGESLTQAFERKVTALQKQMESPEKVAQSMSEALAPMQPHTPGVAGSVATVASRGLSYLQKNMPSTLRTDSIFPTKRRPTDEEIGSFMRRVATVEKPLRALEEMRHGRLSTESVEALREVYPSLYNQMVSEVQTQVASQKKPPPYSKLVQMSILLGKPLDATMTPDFGRFAQGAFTPPQPPSHSGSPQRPVQPMQMNFSKQYSGMSRLAAGSP